MHFFTEVVHRSIIHSDSATAFSSLVSKLRALNVQIETENPDKGEIVTRCLTRLVNGLLWHCWSDKLIFTVTADRANGSRIIVVAVPSFLRFGAADGEHLIELRELLSRLDLT